MFPSKRARGLCNARLHILSLYTEDLSVTFIQIGRKGLFFPSIRNGSENVGCDTRTSVCPCL